jgi:hypothetical protein
MAGKKSSLKLWGGAASILIVFLLLLFTSFKEGFKHIKGCGRGGWGWGKGICGPVQSHGFAPLPRIPPPRTLDIEAPEKDTTTSSR